MDKKKIEKAVRDILEAIGEDPKRKDLLDIRRSAPECGKRTGSRPRSETS
jgi:GTP cyclohydrolase I